MAKTPKPNPEDMQRIFELEAELQEKTTVHAEEMNALREQQDSLQKQAMNTQNLEMQIDSLQSEVRSKAEQVQQLTYDGYGKDNELE